METVRLSRMRKRDSIIRRRDREMAIRMAEYRKHIAAIENAELNTVKPNVNNEYACELVDAVATDVTTAQNGTSVSIDDRARSYVYALIASVMVILFIKSIGLAHIVFA